MPIYEFECRQCLQKFEELVTSSNSRVSCPGCGSTDVNKLISAFGFKSSGKSSSSSSGGCASCAGGSCSTCH